MRQVVRVGLAIAMLPAFACAVDNPTAAAIHGAAAPAWPRVAAVRFEGNRVTRETTLTREIALVEGDAADPAALEAGRQALLDLALFRDVEVRTEARDDGRVDVVYRVHEKRYFLPIPRVNTSSDQDVSYGAQLRWSNVAGFGHRLDAYVERGRFPEDRRRREARSIRLTYEAPYLIRGRYDIHVDLAHSDRVTPRGDTTFDERIRRVELQVAHDLRSGRPRDGWIFGAGLLHTDQQSFGLDAPPSDGSATALLGTANFSNQRFHVFSETGTRFRLHMATATPALGSDYRFTKLTADWVHSVPLGQIEDHHTLRWLASAGALRAGPRSRDEFGLGGSGSLRAYPPDFLTGNRYAYGAVEYLRPIGWDWLRLLVVAEVGTADDDIAARATGRPYASIGLGVRIRVPRFVDVEVEAGIAHPLVGGGGARVFAGGN